VADEPLALRGIRRLAALGDLPNDDDDLRVRKHAFVLAAAGIIAASVLWALAGSAYGQELLAGASFAFAGAGTGILVGFGLTKRYCWSVRSLLVLGMAYVVAGHVSLGGLHAGGGSLAWGLLAPVLAVLLFDVRSGFRWLAVYGGVVVGVMVLDPTLAEIVPPTWDEVPAVILAYNLLGPGLVVLLVTAAVDGERAAARSDYHRLLHEMVPSSVARQLTRGQHRIAEQHPSVSVVFADLVNFTSFAKRTNADDVLLVLNDVINTFDMLAAQFGIEKIKTLGDGYMAVAGAPEPREDHADAAVSFAVALHHAVSRRSTMRSRGLLVRVGIASGPVMAGVIGRRRWAYDLWGDTVNLASRMESTGIPGRIQVSEETVRLVRRDYPFTRRTGVAVRGRGRMSTFTLDPALVADTVALAAVRPSAAGEPERDGASAPLPHQAESWTTPQAAGSG
jgi:adenylate cyclase